MRRLCSDDKVTGAASALVKPENKPRRTSSLFCTYAHCTSDLNIVNARRECERPKNVETKDAPSLRALVRLRRTLHQRSRGIKSLTTHICGQMYSLKLV